MELNMNTMAVYACGGAGINIAQDFLKCDSKKDEGFALFDVTFIDTSKSNLRPGTPDQNLFIIEGKDGFGKKRDSDPSTVMECIGEILHQHRPGTVNVVIHSSSGGSGSVIGPSLVSELLVRGQEVIVITIGSSGSKIEATNTEKTLKSYEAISLRRNKPVPVVYYENDKENTRAVNDDKIRAVVVTLAAMFSGENKELDTADVRNFLNYQNVTSYEPGLCLLDFFIGEVTLKKNETIVSLLTLVDESTSSEVDVPVEYQAVGFISEEAKASMKFTLPVHAAIIVGFFTGVISKLSEKVKAFDDVRPVKVSRITNGEEATDNGLIF